MTLTIEAGVRVEFSDGTGVEVDEGRLLALGSESAPIIFGRSAAASHRWDGIRLIDTLEDNRLEHFSMEYGDDTGESILVDHARITIRNGAWPTTQVTMIEMDHPSVLIEDSAIPGISGGEVVHGEDLVSPGYLILRRNTFGKASNGGDVIDFTGAEAPGPVLQIIDNLFMGGDDDGLDLDGTDAFVSGNVFMDFRKDPANTRATTSNAVATGLPQSGAPNRTRVMMVRNLFLNCDHAVLLKEEAFLTAVNNTFVGMQKAVIQFDETGGTAVQGPGKGATLDGNIFWDYPQMFKHLIAETELTVDRSLIAPAFHDLGTGNLHGDPGFLIVDGAYTLGLGSPAIGTGPNGLDMGYLVAAGASISGEPLAVTWRSGAILDVAGPGIVNYRFRLNGGAWSVDTPVVMPIELGGLSGTNVVEVVGQNSVGDWQADADAAVSESWTVDPDFAQLLLSEIDADAGRVELWNDSGTELDVNGHLINGFTIGGAPPLPAGGYLVVDVPGLRSHGSEVLLQDGAMQMVDSVVYGLQVPGATVARLGRDLEWGLGQPTLGMANRAQALALRTGLRLNEWLLNSDCLFTSDFIEIFNRESLPVSLGGVSVDVAPRLGGDAWSGAPLSFIAAGGFVALRMDGDLAAGGDHSNLDGSGELGSVVSLLDGGGVIDEVTNNSDQVDISGGRATPGGEALTTFTLPTPGLAVEVTTIENITPLVAIDSVWSYEDSDTDLGAAWRELGFDDSAWASGGALLGRETSPDNLPENLVTEVGYVSGIPTYYFRKHFEFSGDPAGAGLRLRTVVDDGAVIYLNGVELHRLRMDDPVTHAAFASDNVGDADYEGPFDLPVGALVAGDNVLAVEVHQDDGASSDIVFGLELEAVEVELISQGIGDAEAILAGLRLTEIMFHPAGDPDAEFLELQNTGTEPLELDGLRFVDGVDFTFPPMVLEPGEFVYVVKDAGAFGHPELIVAGEYSGDLDDAGEHLRLELGFGAGIVDVSYSSGGAIGIGGGGNSLELASDGGLKGGRWAASAMVGGTPGSVSVFEDALAWTNRVFTPTDAANEMISGPGRDPDGDGLVNLLERCFGRDPNSPDEDGMPVLELDGPDLVLRYSRSVSVGDVDLAVGSSEDLRSWSGTELGISSSVISEGAGEQLIEVRVPHGSLGRIFLRIEAIQR